MLSFFRSAAVAVMAACAFHLPAQAQMPQPPEVAARAYLLMDVTTGQLASLTTAQVATLTDAQLGNRERIRQIEVKALQKMRGVLAA